MLYDEEEFFGISSLMNSENTQRVLDELIAELQEMRRMIMEADEDGLRKTLTDARQGYELWLEQRTSGEWEREEKPDVAESRNVLGRLLAENHYLRGISGSHGLLLLYRRMRGWQFLYRLEQRPAKTGKTAQPGNRRGLHPHSPTGTPGLC